MSHAVHSRTATTYVTISMSNCKKLCKKRERTPTVTSAPFSPSDAKWHPWRVERQATYSDTGMYLWEPPAGLTAGDTFRHTSVAAEVAVGLRQDLSVAVVSALVCQLRLTQPYHACAMWF